MGSEISRAAFSTGAATALLNREMENRAHHIPGVTSMLKETGTATLQGSMKSSPPPIKTFLYLLMTLCFLGCSGGQLRSDPRWIGYKETGQASFYAMKYHLRKTASGEPLDQNALTASHRTLPFGTKVRVTNLETGKSVTVKINDRGPFVKGRVIDLTQAAFKKIGGIEAGLIKVQITVVE